MDAARRRQTPHWIEEESGVRDELLGRTREVATVLKGQFGARRVVLFGSLADKQWFGPHSDVDLATEGVTSSQYWDAWRVAGEMIGDRVVDLIEIDDGEAIAASSHRAARDRSLSRVYEQLTDSVW